jgi:DNA-directed RNA polymerase subunit RPC12/RpoP
MPGMAVEPEDETAALTDVEADSFAPRARRTRLSHLEVQDEPSAEARAAERRAARRVFRLYCFSCGRSTESSSAPLRPGRCPTCGGTMLLELAAD